MGVDQDGDGLIDADTHTHEATLAGDDVNGGGGGDRNRSVRFSAGSPDSQESTPRKKKKHRKKDRKSRKKHRKKSKKSPRRDDGGPYSPGSSQSFAKPTHKHLEKTAAFALKLLLC